MFEATITFARQTFDGLVDRFVGIFMHPFDPNHRLFWVYLGTSALVAYFVYRQHVRSKHAKSQRAFSFLSFLFPKKVWSHSSAWLDIRFFFVNELFGKLLYVGLLAGMLTTAFQFVTGGDNIIAAAQAASAPTMKGVLVSFGYMLIAVGIGDFIAFYIHYLQHKIPILWEFHKVHHSPEVMHPISNFREHPMDNVVYSLGIGAGYGVIMGLASNAVGYVPSAPEILGVPILIFLFNIAGYNLRHSHVWLRWPGRWSMIFPSPAHHHVHHSCHPDHLDKNFAFLLPVWDVLFKTYHMPEDNKDVKFGLFGDEHTEYTSVWRLYYLPFRNIYKRLTTEKPSAEKVDPQQDRA